MAVTSSSTIEEIHAQYVDNCDYDVAASTAKAGLFIQAARILLVKAPKRVKQGATGIEIEVDPVVVQSELNAAVAWLAANGGASGSSAGGVVYSDFSGFRD